MQIFLCKLNRSIREDDLHSHFSKYGPIKQLNLKDGFGFLTYENDQDCMKALEDKSPYIGGFQIVVEESNGVRKDRGDTMTSRSSGLSYDRRDVYDRRGGDNFDRRVPIDSFDRRGPIDFYDRRAGDYYDRRDSYGVRDNYERRDSYGDRRRIDYGGRSPVRRCDYCDRCPYHGSIRDRYEPPHDFRQERREHPSDKLKIVLEGISESIENEDLEDFCRANDFTPGFVRISKNRKFGIVELKSLEEKEDALLKLNGKEMKGCLITVREFRTGPPPPRDDYREKRFRNDDGFKSSFVENNNNERKDEVYGDISENDKGKREQMDIN